MNTIAARVVGAIAAGSAFAALSLLGVGSAAAQPTDNKITYCHATHSQTNPYVVVTTAKTAVLQAHQRHQDDEDVIPAFDYVSHGEAGFFPGQTFNGVDPSSFLAGGCAGAVLPQ